jgi:hypothetical protein
MADEQKQVYRVRDSFSTDIKGQTYVLRKGELVDESHPCFKGREALFEPVDADVVREQRERQVVRAVPAVETAVSAPGSKRTRTPAAK